VLVDELFVGKPTEIWSSLQHLYRTGALFHNAWVTLEEALLGFVLGCGAGLVAGVVLGVSRRSSEVLNPLITALYSIPRLALAPLYIVWFGLGLASKVALVVTIVFFLVFYSTYTGVREVDEELKNVLRTMEASRLQVHMKVTLPSAAVWLIASLRVSVPYAFVAAVVGELIASSEGLGYLIGRGTSAFNSNAIFAAIAVVVVMAMALNGLVSLLERSLNRWKAVPDRIVQGM
jgi:NitT/TauT family transport system permease protein